MTTVDTASPTAPSVPATRPTRDRILDAALQESVHAGGPVADPAPKALIAAIEKGDEALAVRLMDEHLSHVESSLTLDRKVPSNDISMALT